jgi:hypothetical protein
MAKNKEIKNEIPIEFKIAEIKKLSHCEKDYSEYGLSEKDLKSVRYEFNLKFEIDVDRESLIFILISNCDAEKENQSYHLFDLEILYRFKIKNFRKVFELDERNNLLQVPDPLMASLLGMVISGVRGILAVVNTNPIYRNFIMPIVDVNSIIESFQKKR